MRHRLPALGDGATRRDRGSMAMFMVLFTPAVLLLAGLLVDGGKAINARQRAADIAGQAARYAANDVNLKNLRSSGTLTIDTNCLEDVGAVVDEYGGVTDYGCVVEGGQTVRVSVTIKFDAVILGLIPGLGSFKITAEADAGAERGI